MFVDFRDFDFLVDWLAVDELLGRESHEMHDGESIRAVLALSTPIAERELATHLRASATNEPEFLPDGTVTVLPEVRKALGVMSEAGLYSTIFDAEHGGLQLPHVAHTAALGIQIAGNLATASFAMLTVANARLLTAHANPAQIEAFAAPEIAGTTMGAMCMSEPQTGSSLGDIRSRTMPDGADELGNRYRVTGNKTWLSGGDQNASENIIHLVLAKVLNEAVKDAPEPAFLAGRICACRFFAETDLPSVGIWVAPVSAGSTFVYDAPIAEF